MARGPRTRLARNIYSDRSGIKIVVERHGVRLPEVKFPHGTDPDVLRKTRDDMIDRLDLGQAKKAIARGTLAADAATCLETLPKGRHKENMRILLGHWTRVFGARPRHSLTPVEIKTQLATFAGRFKPEGLRKLRRALGWVYTTIDGKDGQNPVRAVKAPSVRYDDPRGIGYDVIAWIFRHAPDRGRPQDGQAGGKRPANKTARPTANLSKIRARIMAYTGLHQIEIGRLTAADIDLKRRRVWAHPRQKGSGAAGEWMDLVPPAVQAFRDLVAAKGLGPFGTRSLSRSWSGWLAAAKTAWEADPTKRGQPWPVRPDARPYDLRHSFGTAVYLAEGDIRAAQALLRHRQSSTSDRYIKAGIRARASRGLQAFAAALPVDPVVAPAKIARQTPRRRSLRS